MHIRGAAGCVHLRMKSINTCARGLLGATMVTVALGAAAHDTWFEALPTLRAGEVRLALGTGDRFPVHEYALDARYLVRQGCHGAAGGPAGRLRALLNTDTALWLRAPASAQACWAQLKPFEVTLAPDVVPVYLKEINAQADVRASWAALQARGLVWQETYTKHARINLGPVTAQSREPSGMDVDMLMLAEPGPVRVREPLVVQVLRNGQPLAGFNVELRSELSPLGLWHQTDAQGRVTLQPPLPGRWVLRGTDLALSTSRPDEWESRFITLAFQVVPAVAAPADAPAGRLP